MLHQTGHSYSICACLHLCVHASVYTCASMRLTVCNDVILLYSLKVCCRFALACEKHTRCAGEVSGFEVGSHVITSLHAGVIMHAGMSVMQRGMSHVVLYELSLDICSVTAACQRGLGLTD